MVIATNCFAIFSLSLLSAGSLEEYKLATVLGVCVCVHSRSVKIEIDFGGS